MSSEKVSSANKPSAINFFLIFFLIGGVLYASAAGNMQAVNEAAFAAAKAAVELAISLIGIMAFWLGLMRILEAGGLLITVSRWIKPVMIRLFPDVPPEHPAMGGMIMNISANMLGLGNAATPFGIRAMLELNRLNPLPGTATNAMCLFLAINTSSVTILPLGVIGLRAAAGSSDPSGIFLPTLLATTCSTIAGISLAVFFAKKDRTYKTLTEQALLSTPSTTCSQEGATSGQESSLAQATGSYDHLLWERSPIWNTVGTIVLIVLSALILRAAVISPDPWQFVSQQFLSTWLMPLLIVGILVYGMKRGVKIYEAATEGAKQGFEVATRIIPFLVIILVSVAVFRASGAFELLANLLNPITGLINMPPEVLPMALVRPLSGSGAFAILSDIVKHNPDSYEAYLSSILMGSTETSFYVLAVYFGSIGISKIRHALAAALVADLAGTLAACFFASIFYS